MTKTAREVIEEKVLQTEATWKVYPSADSILSALKEAGYVVKRDPFKNKNGCVWGERDNGICWCETHKSWECWIGLVPLAATQQGE